MIPAVRINLETAVLKRIHERIEEVAIAFAIDMGAGGNYLADEADATAQNYCRGVGFLQGLRRVQDLCIEVEDELIRGKKV